METHVLEKKALTKLQAFPSGSSGPSGSEGQPEGNDAQSPRAAGFDPWALFRERLTSGPVDAKPGPHSDPSAAFVIAPEYRFEGTNEPLQPGRSIRLSHTGGFECGSCGKAVKKLFDGFCYPCLRSKACADNCVMSPHLCHFQAGTCREPAWGETFCYRPHYVYLSFTGKFKVGLTRENQVPVRWVDQGATQAALFARVTSRHQAGVVEKLLMEVMADKSHWLKMLQSGNETPQEADVLNAFRMMTDHVRAHADYATGKLIVETPAHLSIARDITIMDKPVLVTVRYPLAEKDPTLAKPEKLTSVNFDKESVIEGTLLGIKGQYLFLDGGRVFNVRRHEGYVSDVALGRSG